ncbi:MAG: Methyltransferase type 11 [Frankiales bacterium]|nr:Methyltransferase type 11 [Frankiales bacterium]
MTRHPGKPTAFEDLVDDYDAARPGYPETLYEALPPLAGTQVLELGAGTGKQLPGLLDRGAWVVSTDLGPRMLGRLRSRHPAVPALVARAEQLPFADRSFDAVCGAQMWHWVDLPRAAAEVARVPRPHGWLAVWWNEVDAADTRWWQDQQARLEAGNPAYSRTYRTADHGQALRDTGLFREVREWHGSWTRTLGWPLYERWLRSKSYVAALADREAFIAGERQSLAAAFPDGRIVEPFQVRLWVATV